VIIPWAHAALGLLELSLGRAEHAVAELERAARVELALAHLQWGRSRRGVPQGGRHAVASRELEALEEHARVAGLALDAA
jgi:hypothetical protein